MSRSVVRDNVCPTKRLTLFGAIALLSIFQFPLCSAQNKCYYPNGLEATGDSPCDPSAENSACCGKSQGAYCLTNKLCRGPDGNTIRGSCTDKNWTSPECAMYCLSMPLSISARSQRYITNNNHLPGANKGGNDLISCQNVTNTDTSYCCDGHRDFCCDSGVARFDVLPSNPQTWATWNVAATSFIVVNKAQATSTPSSSLSSSATTTPTQTTTSLTSEQPPSTTATYARDNPSESSQAEPNQSPSSLSTAVQAGIGAGVGVVVILIAAIGFLVWKLRRTKKATAEAAAAAAVAAQSQDHWNGYGQGDGSESAGWYYSAGGVSAHKEPLPTQEVDGRGIIVELPGTGYAR